MIIGGKGERSDLKLEAEDSEQVESFNCLGSCVTENMFC